MKISRRSVLGGLLAIPFIGRVFGSESGGDFAARTVTWEDHAKTVGIPIDWSGGGSSRTIREELEAAFAS